METKILGIDEDPHSHDAAKTMIQEIIWRLLNDFEGKNADPADVAVALNSAIANAELPAQPKHWVEATSIEIAGGRDVVMDVRDQGHPHGTHAGHGGPVPTPEERAAE
jgi:hypothetical protein